MSRYIDADLIPYFNIVEPHSGATLFGDIALHGDIDNVPTEDVAPVVHGKWILPNKQTVDITICSNCNLVFESFFSAYQFCPRCGAKMDLEEKQ